MPTRIALPVSRQQRLHQIARRGLMVGAPALDQRDRARQRRAVAGAEVSGEFLDVGGGIFGRVMPWFTTRRASAGEGAEALGSIDFATCLAA